MSSEIAGVRKVHVELGRNSYDVLIGRDLLPHIADLLHQYQVKGPYSIIADAALRKWSEQLQGHLRGAPLSTVPAGENSKSMVHAENLMRQLAQQKLPRSGSVVVLGGGVIGDLAGFVASIYLRGVNVIQLPTTLLAMVDSSIGGKTAVNLPEGKNLVGAFHQPKLVLADLETLSTLPKREFAAGMAEVIKYGVIRDRALFERVAKGVKPGDPDLAEIVEKCVAIKARIVEHDEFETTGERALLNFGHTVGHAIEKATAFKRYLHGEAIALGMRAAAWLSVGQAGMSEAEARQIEAALEANHLPTRLHPSVDKEAILSALGNDKKIAADGGNRWVLAKTIGDATSGWEISSDFSRTQIFLLS
jgi:3-dehydroquinate synthase